MDSRIQKGSGRSSSSNSRRKEKDIKFFENLILKFNFQEEVERIRKKYGIPTKKGFDDKSQEFNWNKEFEDNLNSTQREIQKETVSLSGSGKQVEKIIDRISDFSLDIYRLLKKYELSLEWSPYIRAYVCYGRKHNKGFSHNIHAAYLERQMVDDVIISEQIVFVFGSTVTAPFITEKFLGKTTWSDSIEPLQKLMQGYKEKNMRPQKSKTGLQKEINDLSEAGKSDEEIYMQSEDEIENIESIRKLRGRYKANH